MEPFFTSGFSSSTLSFELTGLKNIEYLAGRFIHLATEAGVGARIKFLVIKSIVKLTFRLHKNGLISVIELEQVRNPA